MKKILIVDDRKSDIKLIEESLKFENYQILHATKGAEAIEIAKKKKPDLIIMDILVPGKYDGLGATEVIKKDPASNKCTIMILSAEPRLTDSVKCHEAGADHYVGKPFNPVDFKARVRRIFNPEQFRDMHEIWS